MIFVPGTSAKPAIAAFPVSPEVAVRITISFFTLFFFDYFLLLYQDIFLSDTK